MPSDCTTPHQDLLVRLDGVQGHVSIAAEDRDDDRLIWITTEAMGDKDGSVSIGVDPADLRAAITFVLGEQP